MALPKMGLLPIAYETFFGDDGEDLDQKSREELQKIQERINKIEDPELKARALKRFEDLGGYDPTLLATGNIQGPEELDFQETLSKKAATEIAEDTALNNISVDPRLKQNQIEALSSLENIADSGGMTLQEEAALQEIRGDTAAANKGRREAILQDMQRRGQGGSGMELLSQLQSNQAATDRNAQAGIDIAAQAQQRALEAMMQQGNMSGQMRSQDFGEQERVAAANDAISKFNTQNQNQMNRFNTGNQIQTDQFNTQNRMGTDQFNIQGDQENRRFNAAQDAETQRYNTEALNRAAASQAERSQQIANANVDITNQEAAQHNDIAQQNFNNKLKKTGLQNQSNINMADHYGRAADRKAKKEANEQASVMKAGTTAAAVMASDERVKKDIGDIDSKQIEEFFNSFDPKTYRYKSKKHGDPKQDKLGFMLQDVENTELGKKLITEDEEGIKHYDSQNLDGIILAAISDLMKEKK